MSNTPYYQVPNKGENCSTPRSKALRKRRFDMGYEKPDKPAIYDEIAELAAKTVLDNQDKSPATARALALRAVIERAPVEFCPNSIFLGGENPFFYNLMLDALQNDAYGSACRMLLTDMDKRRSDVFMISQPCFDGHITPGCDLILAQGTSGLRLRVTEHLENARAQGKPQDVILFYEALLLSLDNIEYFAAKIAQKAAESNDAELIKAGEILTRVPKYPARSYREALQSYWIIHVLITLEMGGCMPGGGIGLGRPDQYLYPYYKNDIDRGELSQPQALEYTELFLLNFRHNDYYTPHQITTPGTHGSLCGITPTGYDATNELSLIFMEASLRIQMPAPYLSIRLNKKMSDASFRAVSNYITGGLGFPIVNDEVLIPAFLRHGRSLYDANDYICSCCYENTIPGRESFNPNSFYLNLAIILEAFLNKGYAIKGNGRVLEEEIDLSAIYTFDEFFNAYLDEMKHVLKDSTEMARRAEAYLMPRRSYPLMSLFMEDCIAKGKDICNGGSRYNLTGIIVSAIPNIVNSLSAIREVIFNNKAADLQQLSIALKNNFEGYDGLRAQLLKAPKWGNGIKEVDDLASVITECLYSVTRREVNPRNGRYQLALYSFIANVDMGQRMGASPDGRLAGEIITRNLNPSWGSDKNGPIEILRSLSSIDMTKFPNGTALDLRFDPTPFETQEGRDKFTDFLKGMMDLKVMQMQISFVDTQTLITAKAHPEQYPNLMVKVAGYSARFVDLTDIEKDEIIGRSAQTI